YAASSTHGIAPAMLTERLGLVAGEPEGRRVAVLTKDTTPEVAELLHRRPDAVGIHAAFPRAAPPAHTPGPVSGAGRASTAEAVRRCAPERDAPGWQQLVGLRAPTEERNPRTTELDTLGPAELVATVLAEDATVAASVAAAAEPLARLVEAG